MLERNLLTSILLYESIRTTKKRAQVIRPQVDRIITFAKTHTPMQAIRFINRKVTDKNACKKVMEVFVDRYKDRTSGLTRMVPAGARDGDGAEIVDLMLVDAGVEGSGNRESGSRIPKPESRSKSKKITSKASS
jgi:large subunit ribosomal protein L17